MIQKEDYDALVAQGTPMDLSRQSLFFVEFKYMLTSEFNHSFDHLIAIVCWDCNLSEGAQLHDIQDKKRELHIIPATEPSEYTRYMLVSTRERHNIEVFVLKEYLREKKGIEFRSRQQTSSR